MQMQNLIIFAPVENGPDGKGIALAVNVAVRRVVSRVLFFEGDRRRLNRGQSLMRCAHIIFIAQHLRTTTASFIIRMVLLDVHWLQGCLLIAGPYPAGMATNGRGGRARRRPRRNLLLLRTQKNKGAAAG